MWTRRSIGVKNSTMTTRLLREREEGVAVAETFDVAIAGGGFVGLAAALGLRRRLGRTARVVVIDPRGRTTGDRRAYAIAAASRDFLAALGVWPAIEALAEPVRAMEISDSTLGDPARPTLLTFAPERAQPALAHMVPGVSLAAALGREAEAADVEFILGAPADVRQTLGAVQFNVGQATRAARLLVAADGARSSLRESIGIPYYGWRYAQQALVATLTHDRPHEGRAIEHFLPGGPFALLPLPGMVSSLVWSDDPGAHARAAAGGPEGFRRAIEERAAGRLGAILAIEDVATFPLAMGLARRFAAGRVALAGDAAHQVHPIAGQGLNIGLLDAEALVRAVGEAASVGLDPGDGSALRNYEAARRFGAVSMAFVTDGLNRLFSRDGDALRALRTLGLGLVERTPALTGFFIGQASGGLIPRAGAPRRAA